MGWYKKFYKWNSDRMDKMDLWDIALIKNMGLFFGLFLAAVLPVLTTVRWYLWLAIYIIVAARPFYRGYVKK
ncbi:hypothetical protein KY362_07690 [Candidatus Woesearchaeota archaeon]|nr:hypothetical protein [Candidatus Woesearchaeota archaeon]